MDGKNYFPNVNLSMLNALSEEKYCNQLSLLLGRLLEKFYFAKLNSLSLEVLKLRDAISPYIFYINHYPAAIDFDISLGDSDKPANTYFSRGMEISEELETLRLEHFALQLVGTLGELFFANLNFVFRGKVVEETYSELDCVSLVLHYRIDEQDYSGRINLFIPSELSIDTPIEKDGCQLSKTDIHSKDKISCQIFLGTIFVRPANLVDILTPGFVCELSKDITFDNCSLILDNSKNFKGSLRFQSDSLVFIYESADEVLMKNSRAGYSAINLRVYTANLDNDRVENSFPYFDLGSVFGNEVEMLIGGELVAMGILEQRKDGMFLKVC